MDFSNMTLDELLEAREELNEQIKSVRKEEEQAQKEAQKEEQEALDAQKKEELENIDEGDPVRVIYKDEEITAAFVKTTEKRFVVEIDGDKRALLFRKYVGPAESEAVA